MSKPVNLNNIFRIKEPTQLMADIDWHIYYDLWYHIVPGIDKVFKAHLYETLKRHCLRKGI